MRVTATCLTRKVLIVAMTRRDVVIGFKPTDNVSNPSGCRRSDTVATVLKFISRGEQVRLRGLRNFAQWNRIRLGIDPFGPDERSRLFHRQAKDEAKDRTWAQRHHPLPEGSVVLPFTAGWGNTMAWR
jgi:hypothetical protein